MGKGAAFGQPFVGESIAYLPNAAPLRGLGGSIRLAHGSHCVFPGQLFAENF